MKKARFVNQLLELDVTLVIQQGVPALDDCAESSADVVCRVSDRYGDLASPLTVLHTQAIPNETLSKRAPCKRQRPGPVPLGRPRAPTTRRRSRFPGVARQHRLAAAHAPRREAPAAANQRGRRVPTERSSGTE